MYNDIYFSQHQNNLISYPYSIELFTLTQYLCTVNIYGDSVSLHNNTERDRIDTTVPTFVYISRWW